MDYSNLLKQLFLLLNLWSSASKTFSRQAISHSKPKRQWQHSMIWREATLNVELSNGASQAGRRQEAYCLVGWLFWVGDGKQAMVRSLSSYHLRCFWHLSTWKKLVKIGLKMGQFWGKIGKNWVDFFEWGTGSRRWSDLSPPITCDVFDIFWLEKIW